MKAKKKPIEKLQASDIGVDITPLLETIRVSEPPKRSGGVKVGLLLENLRLVLMSTSPGRECGPTCCEAKRGWYFMMHSTCHRIVLLITILHGLRNFQFTDKLVQVMKLSNSLSFRRGCLASLPTFLDWYSQYLETWQVTSKINTFFPFAMCRQVHTTDQRVWLSIRFTRLN